jgi:hypothetical protein
MVSMVQDAAGPPDQAGDVAANVNVEAAIDAVLIAKVSTSLKMPEADAALLVTEVAKLYNSKMQKRFTDLRFSNRLKRTNPFLLKVRGIKTVVEWAENQVRSALLASEEEALGHVLEAIIKVCHPHAAIPIDTDDFDFEVVEPGLVTAYQIKMSWDCMPMSARKNLSATIRRRRDEHEKTGIKFEGIFAPCYGRPTTSRAGQEYTTMRSRDFWSDVGAGDADFDFQVGNVCGLLCSEFRRELAEKSIPRLITMLATEGAAVFGDAEGNIDYLRLFRAVNR